MRVLIQGPGAIGRLLAARMKLNGVEVALLDYRPERARELETQGIRLEGRTRDGERSQRVFVPVLRTTDPRPAAPER